MNIIIEFNKETKNVRELSQAIKIFLKKYISNYSFTLVGPKELLFTISEEKRINIIDLQNKEEIINKALELSKEKDSALLCFGSPKEIISIANNALEFKNKNKLLVTGTSFLTKEVKKPVMLVNIDNINDEGIISYQEMSNLFNDYLKKKDTSKTKTFKFLKTGTEFDKGINDCFNKDNDYKGLIEIKDLLKPECDYILGKSLQMSTFLDTFNLVFHAVNDIENDKMNDTTLIKIGKSLTKSINIQIENTFDKKTRSFGTILLGYSYPIIFAKDNDNVNSLLNIFNTVIY
ncbi:MAG: hypothetical protein WCR97_02950 [Bacilli bacterium]